MINNSKTKKLIIFSLVLSFLTYQLCNFIAEKYFFDKFFYQKSVKYGYGVVNEKNIKQYGDRSVDINQLLSPNTNILSLKNPSDLFTIIVLGDSHVWGQGIKNQERFTKILEKKLNQVRPTKIISLAFKGDGIFDNYSKYLLSKSIWGEVDLYIISFVFNDLLLNNTPRYQTDKLIDQYKQDCTGTEIYDVNMTNRNDFDFYTKKMIDSFQSNSKNYCIYKKIIKQFPENTIYFDSSSLVYSKEMSNLFLNSLSSDINILSPYTDNQKSYNPDYRVSPREGHPNALANQMYADILFTEITTNPKWGFIQ